MKLIYPWNDIDFQWSKDDLNSIYYNLKKLNYNIPKNEPESIYLSAINKIMPTLLSDDWLILFSNNTNLLHKLSNDLPVIYSLNSTYSSYTISNSIALSALSKGYEDDSVEILDNIKLSTLLFWANLLETPYGIQKYAGSFFDILYFRYARKCTTVFTVLYSGESLNKKMLDIITSKIDNSFGKAFSSLLFEKSDIIDIPLKSINNWDKVRTINL